MGYAALRLGTYRRILQLRGEAGFFTTAADLDDLATVSAVTAHAEYRSNETADQNTSDEFERLRVFCLADPADADYGGVAAWEIGDVYYRPGDYDPDGATAADRQVNKPFMFQGTYLNDGPNDTQAFTVEVVRQIRRRQGRRS